MQRRNTGKLSHGAALRDPNTLARKPARSVDFAQETMMYAARWAYEQVTGKGMPYADVDQHVGPNGERWDEGTVDQKYPELAAKFAQS